MLLLCAILAVLLNGDLTPKDFEGPAWVGVAVTALYVVRRSLDMMSDYFSARRIRADEERLKKEAAQVAPTTVPFIPESLEARIFRLEKDKLEEDMKELRATNDVLRVENTRLHEKNAELQDEVLLEQRKSADLRIELRREREQHESERARRITEPMRR